MFRILPWLLSFCLAIAGWFLSRRRPELARKLARGLAIVPAVLLFVLATSGWSRANSTAAEVHRWSGHGLVIALWLTVPFAIGVTLELNRGRKIGGAALLLLALLVSSGAAFTGYLDRTNGDEETKNRFVVLHMATFPAILAAILAAWIYIFRNDRPLEVT